MKGSLSKVIFASGTKKGVSLDWCGVGSVMVLLFSSPWLLGNFLLDARVDGISNKVPFAYILLVSPWLILLLGHIHFPWAKDSKMHCLAFLNQSLGKYLVLI